MHAGEILLVRVRSTGKYAAPGGGIGIDERIEDALRREVKEEAGIDIEIERFTHFRERFFYYDPHDTAYHSFLFYYIYRPKTWDLAEDEAINDSEAETPGWVAVQDLRPEDFQNEGETILSLVR